MEKMQKRRKPAVRSRRLVLEGVIDPCSTVHNLKCVLHGGVKVNGLYIRERSFNTSVLRKIGKHFRPNKQMPAPAVAGSPTASAPDAILSRKRAAKSAENLFF